MTSPVGADAGDEKGLEGALSGAVAVSAAVTTDRAPVIVAFCAPAGNGAEHANGAAGPAHVTLARTTAGPAVVEPAGVTYSRNVNVCACAAEATLP